MRCNKRYKYGKKICEDCDHVIFSLFDHEDVENNGNGEVVYVTINNIKISVVWNKLITDIQKYNHKRIKTIQFGTPEPKTDSEEESVHELPRHTTDSPDTAHTDTHDNTHTDNTHTDNTYTDDVLSDEEDDVFAMDTTKNILTQRQHIINEILTTERDYLNDLDFIIEVCSSDGGARNETYWGTDR